MPKRRGDPDPILLKPEGLRHIHSLSIPETPFPECAVATEADTTALRCDHLDPIEIRPHLLRDRGPREHRSFGLTPAPERAIRKHQKCPAIGGEHAQRALLRRERNHHGQGEGPTFSNKRPKEASGESDHNPAPNQPGFSSTARRARWDCEGNRGRGVPGSGNTNSLAPCARD